MNVEKACKTLRENYCEVAVYGHKAGDESFECSGKSGIWISGSMWHCMHYPWLKGYKAIPMKKF